MSRALAFALASLVLAGCAPDDTRSQAGTAGAVEVAGALCRPTPVGRHTTGCYLTLTAAADDRLVGVSSPVAGRAQIHESRMESNMMMMRELKEGLPLPAGQTVELKPGGNHIMLLAVDEPLKTGDTVVLTLTFEAARPIDVVARVDQPTLSDYGTPSR